MNRFDADERSVATEDEKGTNAGKIIEKQIKRRYERYYTFGCLGNCYDVQRSFYDE